MLSSVKYFNNSNIFLKNIYRSFSSSNITFSGRSDSNSNKRTPLYDLHCSNGGKLVNFAGYLLPVNYTGFGITESHLHTRKSASLFDVSHMLQTEIKGKDCISCFETICTADIKNVPDNTSYLTVFTDDNGGILDDLIVTKVSSDHLYIVSNAAMKSSDKKIMENAVNNFKTKGHDVSIEFQNEKTLLALQGPKAAEELQKLTKTDLNKLFFMNTTEAIVAGVTNCRITRCGYTGEDGFEISIPADKGIAVAEAILNAKDSGVKLAGLGARDTLRLEAGLCLYGNDINRDISPIEAALAFLVAKRRRLESNFPGAEKINEKIKCGVEYRRCGLSFKNGPPARSGTEVYLLNSNENGTEKIGHVTSGCFSPILKHNIAMGYIKDVHRKIGTKIEVKIRDKFYEAEITKMPFVKTNYRVKPKA